MRLAQTGSYGVMPNPAMENTFLAQAGDLDDPVAGLNCYHSGCCTNVSTDAILRLLVLHRSSLVYIVYDRIAFSDRLLTVQMSKSPSCTEGIGCDKICQGGHTPDYSWADTPVYMGPIHPRDKKPVGVRMARAAATLVYKKAGAFTGPTITGCAVSADKKSLTVKFNVTLLAGDKMIVQDYSKSNTSQMSILVNAEKFCFQSSGGKGGSICKDDGFGNFNSTGPINDKTDWAPVGIKAGSEPNTIEVDLSSKHLFSLVSSRFSSLFFSLLITSNRSWAAICTGCLRHWLRSIAAVSGGAFGIRYGWQGGGSCCAEQAPGNYFCEPASCPLMLATAKLPANPFMAKIVGGKCKCMPPQVCDE